MVVEELCLKVGSTSPKGKLITWYANFITWWLNMTCQWVNHASIWVFTSWRERNFYVVLESHLQLICVPPIRFWMFWTNQAKWCYCNFCIQIVFQFSRTVVKLRSLVAESWQVWMWHWTIVLEKFFPTIGGKAQELWGEPLDMILSRKSFQREECLSLLICFVHETLS